MHSNKQTLVSLGYIFRHLFITIMITLKHENESETTLKKKGEDKTRDKRLLSFTFPLISSLCDDDDDYVN